MMVDRQFEDLAESQRKYIPPTGTMLKTKATPDCPNGTRGRTAVMEIVEVSDQLEQMILKGASEAELYQVARKNGFMSMRQHAIIKALKHEIPFEEVNSLGGALMEADPEVQDEITKENVDNTTSAQQEVVV